MHFNKIKNPINTVAEDYAPGCLATTVFKIKLVFVSQAQFPQAVNSHCTNMTHLFQIKDIQIKYIPSKYTYSNNTSATFEYP